MSAGKSTAEDRELLERAAKAAGYTLHIWGSPGIENVARMDCKPTVRWNPLTGDGDAFRLAVKLKLSIMFGSPENVQVSADDGGEFCTAYAIESTKSDAEAATRRAIVRAAAALSKTGGAQ